MLQNKTTISTIKTHEFLVSIVIPFYHNKIWLFEALESVYNQSCSDFEIILINDGSKEDISILKNKYPLVRLYEIANSGPGKARNVGIELARGEFIAFLDSDDLWLPTKLDSQIKFMRDSGFEWSHSNYERFYEDNLNLQKVDCSDMQGNIIPKMFLSCSIATPCIVIKKNILVNDSSLRFSEDKRIGEDSYFWIKLAQKFPLGFLEMNLCKVRMRGTNAALQVYLQLKSRSDNYEFIKNYKVPYGNNRHLILVKSAFYLCRKSFNWVELLIKYFNLKEYQRELISKVFYILPYIYIKAVFLFVKNDKMERFNY
ncbi:glycosyltransferase family 2 protein [Flavobacterium sp. GP15]|uniref:glycosyltransferase family 2 protein n=1 Tax=Flavobacterium sp. GP15 TaxID=2758567 RepID=UPI00165E45D2|nr:glycosyltransferase family 2 protein [Flavobacterium sp. GP15]